MPEPLQGRGSPVRHAVSLAFFGLLSLLCTWPLAHHLTGRVLGAGAGDNLSAVWNIWWARTALFGPASLFRTDALFAPFGADLVLHSFAPLESAVAGASSADPVGAYNAALIAAVFLNFSCAYWACWTLTRHSLASCFGAVAFGGAPFLLVRLHGHMNVLNAWGLPLLWIAARRYQRNPTPASAVLLGLALALLAYTDAYFAIFGGILAIAYLALIEWPIRVGSRPLTSARRRALRAAIVPMLVVGVVIAWIEWTGGTDTQVAGIRLRMTDSFNPRVILGFLMMTALVIWKPPVLRREPLEARRPTRAWTLLPAAFGVAAVLALPLAIAAVRLWRAGDYESQVYFWRSAPPGIDLAALALGNPLSALAGRWSGLAYEALGIDRSESAVWIGAATIVVIVSGFRRWRTSVEARSLAWIGGLFLVWSLGPYLRAFGFNTAFMLPQTMLRFVPVVANARIPGRAFVVVLLMAALLASMALVMIADNGRRVRLTAIALAALVVDVWPVAHPWIPVERPPVYDVLRRQPPGIVLELPLGWRDGFGHRGNLDHRVLLYQTLHEHPLMGGFVARVSGRIKRAYESDPILGPLLDLSEDRPSAAAVVPACQLTCGVRYLVVDEARASPDLKAFVERAFTLRPLDRSETRVLYVVE